MDKDRAEKTLKIIEKQYTSFIDQQNNWDFFRGLAEYIKTLQETMQTKPILEAFEKQREMARKTYEMMNTDAMKELRKSAERMTKIAQEVVEKNRPMLENAQKIAKEVAEQRTLALSEIEKYQNQYDHIANAVKEVQDHLNGRILSSRPLDALSNGLFDVARQVKASGNEEVIKEFEDENRKIKNIYGNYTFSPIYEKISDEEVRVERKEEVEPWGAWWHLPLVKKLVYEPEETKESLQKEVEADRSLQWIWLNFAGVYVEMEKIRKGEKSDKDATIFNMKDFRSYAQRVHTFIATELLKTENEDTKGYSDFDNGTSTLTINGQKVKFRKHTEQYHTLRIIFEDKKELKKEWFFSEIGEKMDKYKDYKDKDFHNYVSAIKKRIAVETGIKDFFETTNQSLKINNKYLS